MDLKSTLMTATSLHSKFSMKGTIAKLYKDAHSILVTKIDGYKFRQLIMNQTHPLLADKNITTIDIPNYLTYNIVFHYAREIK